MVSRAIERRNGLKQKLIGILQDIYPEIHSSVLNNFAQDLANLAQKNNIHSFIFISSGYANSKSSGDYLRFKGLVEEELISLNFNNLGILRPSFLLGNRKEKRIGEKIGIVIFKSLSPLMIGPLKRMKPIHVKTVAGAMIKIAQSELNQTIFESDEIVKLNED